ncbi:hypothetical protein XELAEV_18002680mg [Xenopus laevis]|uniref:Uncharacterized protein n=1 Tax=Xenopus laevis TaxID=8355 RepID=A0A974GYC5_XENLA|nr:hypothetical protein XELAEV_18002680mg [Xenopus laevis]
MTSGGVSGDGCVTCRQFINECLYTILNEPIITIQLGRVFPTINHIYYSLYIQGVLKRINHVSIKTFRSIVPVKAFKPCLK